MTFKMQLTNGTDSIEILNEPHSRAGHYLQSNSYTPQINRRNQTGFGDVYLPVGESFTLTVLGATPNDVHERLAALVNLMDSVQLWDDSDAAAADAVNFIYKPTGSTEAVDYRALVTGGASVNYSQYIEQVGKWFRLINIQVSFSRGIWLGAEETAVSSTLTQPAVLQATFTSSAALPSPVNAEIGITAKNPSIFSGDTLTVLASEAMEFYEAEALSGSLLTGTTPVAKASGGSILFATPAGLGVPSPAASLSFVAGVNDFPFDNFAIYATMRNKSSTVSWTIETSISAADGTVSALNRTLLDAGLTTPQILNLGSFYFQDLHTSLVDILLGFTFVNSTTGTTADNLEFDCFVIVPLKSDATGHISTNTVEMAAYGSNGKPLEAPSGVVYGKFSSSYPEIPVSFTGNSKQKTLTGDIYAIHLFVYGATDGWRHHAAASSTTHDLIATRRLASLTPK